MARRSPTRGLRATQKPCSFSPFSSPPPRSHTRRILGCGPAFPVLLFVNGDVTGIAVRAVSISKERRRAVTQPGTPAPPASYLPEPPAGPRAKRLVARTVVIYSFKQGCQFVCKYVPAGLMVLPIKRITAGCGPTCGTMRGHSPLRRGNHHVVSCPQPPVNNLTYPTPTHKEMSDTGEDSVMLSSMYSVWRSGILHGQPNRHSKLITGSGGVLRFPLHSSFSAPLWRLWGVCGGVWACGTTGARAVGCVLWFTVCQGTYGSTVPGSTRLARGVLNLKPWVQCMPVVLSLQCPTRRNVALLNNRVFPATRSSFDKLWLRLSGSRRGVESAAC